MYRRPIIAMMSSKASRTIIRDPRKNKRIKSAIAVAAKEREQNNNSLEIHQPESHPPQQYERPRMAFEPSQDNQQSLGLGSYMLAGVGVALGVTLVSVVFGAIGA